MLSLLSLKVKKTETKNIHFISSETETREDERIQKGLKMSVPPWMEEQNPYFLVNSVQAYKGKAKGELSFKKGQKITVTHSDGMQYFGMIGDRSGTFPFFYVQSTGIKVEKVS